MTGFPAKSVKWTVCSWSSWRVKLATFSFSSMKDSSLDKRGLGKARRPQNGAEARGNSLADLRERFPAVSDYFRPEPGLSSSRQKRAPGNQNSGDARWLAGAVLLAFCAVATAQYPGRVTKTDKNTPVLRSIAVLEWTGDSGKPSASRLVPVTVYDGEQLNDGTIYMNRPEPLALASGVEYELQKDGRPTGLYDVFGSGEQS